MLSNINISFLMPTCNKAIGRLEECLNSIFNNISAKDEIEVILRIDEGDSILEVADKYIQNNVDYNIDIIVGERFGYKYHYKYINELASRSSGKFLIPFPDDYLIHTKKWDLFLKDFLDKPVILRPKELYHIKHYNTEAECMVAPRTNICPIINRLIYNELGYISPVIAYDSWIDYIAKKSGIQRVIDMKVTHFRTTNSLRKFRRKEFSDAKKLLKTDIQRIKNFIEERI